MKIIALAGKARSGKNTVASIIRRCKPNWAETAFAKPMKDFCQELFSFSDAQMHGAEKELPDPRYKRSNGLLLTPRFALQTLGTEWGRNCDPDIWAKAAIERGKRWADTYQSEGIIITDCRFPNEAKIVKENGGEVWHITRPIVKENGGEVWHITRPMDALEGAAGEHVSETIHLSPDFQQYVDRRINNYGTLFMLESLVASIAETL